MTTSGMYDTPDGADAYAAMAVGYDGRDHVERLQELLAPGSEVLELGIGPGVDLAMLAETFTVLGSDLSRAFLDRCAREWPDVELTRLDAITIETDRRFDAIYSNKVLHHLTKDELRQSLHRQSEIIRPEGLMLHGLWAGTTAENHDGLPDTRYLPDTIAAVVPETLDIIECTFYTEMTTDDSIRVILRPRTT